MKTGQSHIDRCHNLAKSKGKVCSPMVAAFCAGAALIDEAEQANEHDVAQLAQDAFPDVDSLEIAKAALTIADAIAVIHASRRKVAQAQLDQQQAAASELPVVVHSSRTPPCPACSEPVDPSALAPDVIAEVCFSCPHCGEEIRLHHDDDRLVLYRTPFPTKRIWL